ncbi:MAG: alpha/beta hydrolase [Solobacterium sp.]|nr:alpha/beta hydrolase [Solobacterium sp.]
MFVHVNGLDLYYEKKGSGRPLLLIHGNGEDHTIFDEAVNELKEQFTCYALDTRGHGQSTFSGSLHYEDMADDITGFIDALQLEDVICYGFSDGGITGLLAASRCGRIRDLIVSGANITPDGVKGPLKAFIRLMYLFTRDDKMRLMLEEPQIPLETLRSIKARTLVLAGEKDLVSEIQTLTIGANIPFAETRILKGEGHGSYIVHSTKIAFLIDEFVQNA